MSLALNRLAIPSRLVSSMDESPLIDCFIWSMDESPSIDCTAAGSFEIVVSCPVFKAILLPYRLTSFRVSERLKRPLAIPMCTVPYQSNTNPCSNFLSREFIILRCIVFEYVGCAQHLASCSDNKVVAEI